ARLGGGGELSTARRIEGIFQAQTPAGVRIPLAITNIGRSVVITPIGGRHHTLERSIVEEFGPHSWHYVVQQLDKVAKKLWVDSTGVKVFGVDVGFGFRGLGRRWKC